MVENIQNPYIGLRTYEEADAALFRGRKTATNDLFRIISENDVVVLHAESGEGKSSLLNAGLSPLLRDERYFPIRINFTDDDFLDESPNFDNIIFNRIKNAINEINHDSAEDVFSENARLDGKISLTPIRTGGYDVEQYKELRDSSWWLLRNYVLNAYGAVLTPVLVFDQFEEVFTRPSNISWTEDFFAWLKTTLSDEIPSNISQRIREIIGEDAPFPRLSTDKHFKALFSLRTEYIGELDYWAIQRHQITVLKNSRFCLKPLTEDEADEVLSLQPAFTESIREQIKTAICSSQRNKYRKNQLPVIPAMLLSVVSTTATANIEKEGKAFTQISDITGEEASTDLFNNIVAQFYHKEISDAKLPQRDIKSIENILVDDKGKRVRIKADAKELRKIDFINRYKEVLEQKRLIKCTQINGDEYVELSHDALARVIIQHRKEKNAQSNKIFEISSKFLCVVQVIVTLVVFWSIVFRFTEYFENGAEFWRIIKDIPSKTYKALIYGVSAYAYIKLRSGESLIHKRFILGCGIILTLFGYVILIHAYKPNSNLLFGVGCNALIIAPLIISLLCSGLNRNVRCVLIFASLSVITGNYIWPIEYLIFKLAIFILLSLTLFSIKGKLRIIKYIFDKIILIGVSTILIFSCVQVSFPILLTLSTLWFLSVINRNGNERWIMILCIILDVFALSCVGVITSSHWPYQSILSDSDVLILLCPIIGLIVTFCFRPYGNKQKFIKETLCLNYLTNDSFYKIIGVSMSLVFITISSVYIGRFLNDIASLVWLIIGTVSSFIAISYLAHLLFKSNSLNYNRIIIVSVILSAISIAISLCQYLDNRLLINAILILVGLSIVMYGIYFSNNYGVAKTSKYRYLSQGIYCIIGGVYILIGLPIASNGYNMYKYNSYARVWNGTIKVVNASSAQSNLSLVKLHKELNCRLITVTHNNLYGVRDYNNIVIPPSYSRIGGTAIYTLSYESTGAPDCIFYATEQSNPKIIALSNNLNAKNSITNKLMDDIKYYLINATDASVETATNYLNGLYARNNNKLSVSMETNEVVKRIILDLVNRSIKGKGGIPINYFDDLTPKILNDISCNQLMGDYVYLLPFCTDDFNQNLIDNILGNSLLLKAGKNTIYVKDMKKNGFIKLNNKEVKPTAYFHLYPFYLFSNKVADANKMIETLIEHETLLGGLRPKFISDLVLSYHLLGNDEKALEVLNKYGNKLITINGNSTTKLSDLKEGEWYSLRYNSPNNQMSNYLDSYKAKNLLNNAQIIELKKMVTRNNVFRDEVKFDFIQIIDGDSVTLRHIKYNGGKHTYSYYTYNGVVVTPFITNISLPKDSIGPTLTIDYNTHKRHFINYGTPSVAMNGWKLPKTIDGEFDHAWRFSEGVAAVENNGKIGFINENGQSVLPYIYYSNNSIESVDPYRPYNNVYNGRNFVDVVFINGLCPVANSSGKYGLINRKGKWVLTPEYDFIGTPDEYGFRKVRKGNRYGLLDSSGTPATPIKFSKYIYTISPDSVSVSGDYKSIKETWN